MFFIIYSARSTMMMFSRCLVHAILIILAVWTINIDSFLTTSSSSKYFDRSALIAIKDKIMGDPQEMLSSWNDSVHYCEWNGVTCSRRHRFRVTHLDLSFQKLEGTLSPHIGNLSFLHEIRLTKNKFQGPIPQEIGRLLRLQILVLDTNSFVGEIPTNLSQCSNLRQINLIDNRLSGGIPIALTSLSKLIALRLSKNEQLIKGSIPSSLGNLSSLQTLSLRECSLNGRIPNDLCRISTLNSLDLDSNNLNGTIPSCLYNLSQITVFAIVDNQLEGRLPQHIGLTLPNLQEYYVAMNNFTGPIPLSLVNASQLRIIEFSENQFTGQVPINLGRLQDLCILNLHDNRLGLTTGDDLNFISSLTNCTKLQRLFVDSNSLQGSLPTSIANLSTQITNLGFGNNKIHGRIPAGIEHLANLTMFGLDGNYLTGEIPKVFGMFSNLRDLYLNKNQFSGQIPDSFINSTSLTNIDLSGNKLHGRVPLSLGNCQNLLFLVLSNNRLSGSIPKNLFGLSSLSILLDLSNNAFSGFLPSDVGNLSNLVQLDISYNRLSGPIPNKLGNCLNLAYLNMAGNFFTGNIPRSLSTLKGVKELNLSHNKLYGEIPKYLSNFTLLTLDLSYNELKGPVPTDGVFANVSAISIVGNSELCGGVVGLNLTACPIQTSKKKGNSLTLKVLIPMILVSASLLLLLALLLTSRRRRKSTQRPWLPSLFDHQYKRISYAELFKATNSFSSDNLIGNGSYGIVYKGILPKVNTMIAVKVLNLQQRGALKSFVSECNAFRNLRHRNLLKIITCCSSVDFQGNNFKALVFEFMSSGSLEEWLHPKRYGQQELRSLHFRQRLDIAVDVASALDYLHHHCQPAIVHCDLKPSNVLLDDDLTAHVADFGLAKIFSTTSHNSSQSQGSSLAIKGSIGYVAPEYGIGGEVSKQGDVYSYGILLLEMFTGMAPTNDMFQDGRNLHGFAKAALPDQVMNIVDPMFLDECHEALRNENQKNRRARMQECLVLVIRLGVKCSAESPMVRMNMGDVVTELCHIKDYHQESNSTPPT